MTQEHIHPFIQLIIDSWDKSGAWSEIVEAMRLVLPVGIGAAESREDPSRWALLPGLCCQAAGGDPQAAKEISSAWLLLHIAAHIVDDVEDGDLEGLVALPRQGDVCHGVYLVNEIVARETFGVSPRGNVHLAVLRDHAATSSTSAS